MKKIGTVLAAVLFLLAIAFTSSDLYLAAGSDAIDLIYKAPSQTLAAVMAGFLLALLMTLYSRLKWMAVPTSGLLVLLLLLSQAVVDSGKRQQIEYYVAGVQLASIPYDPTGDGVLTVVALNPLVSELAIQGQSLTVVSGLCSLCIDLSGLANP